ncbi:MULTISPECIES: glycerate kinase [unclassified Lentimonas]|uniref:glycerate kinase n=1 Tax=unclassified Lentimonas TaxID=2630993 RepID=UPI00132C9A0C|nr:MULTISPECIES: glycerate kinase [unclassified Lentimonas]CAA6679957.1 Glycerate kinase (EC [Lentimonas sp. CC4]CAA6686513.1 Glycerate kinase (EC [Lentimonas sp. CC6]CAA7074789.1 Glycerate kinase (EC [Lentimonas sp. CC4]CAA7169416.1 Glycerate kinase (EC [Lentimonas sp. CC21]CAA7180193.1 Glycerate kinase (EC [Lentimonas sp. CC8]
MKILTAFDKFKDSMTAATACEAAAYGAQDALGASAQITQAPLTDGGEGFCSILTNAADGFIEQHTVCGPLGADLEAPLGWVQSDSLPEAVRHIFQLEQGKVAIIEMAAAAGLEQVPAERRHPKHCTTYGVGELIRIAVAEGADAILLGIGGSATSDLGLGLLQALGLQFGDSNGHTIERILPSDWPQVTSIAGSIEVQTPPIFIACDVDNPLLGSRGAAAVYGPQKGLLAEEHAAFEADSASMASKLCQFFNQPESALDTPGSGAAGGIGFGLNVACGGQYVAGFDLVEAWLDLKRKVAEADLILTGEGKIDRSSLNGKGPIALARAAHAADKPCILLAGCVEAAAAKQIHQDYPNAAAYAITPEGCALEQALAQGQENLKLKTNHVLRQSYPR